MLSIEYNKRLPFRSVATLCGSLSVWHRDTDPRSTTISRYFKTLPSIHPPDWMIYRCCIYVKTVLIFQWFPLDLCQRLEYLLNFLYNKIQTNIVFSWLILSLIWIYWKPKKAEGDTRVEIQVDYCGAFSFLLRSCLNVFQFSNTEVLLRFSGGLVGLSLRLLRVEDMKWIEFSIFFHFEGALFDWMIDLLLV